MGLDDTVGVFGTEPWEPLVKLVEEISGTTSARTEVHRKRVIVCAKTEEQEQRCKPHADSKESGDVCKAGSFDLLFWSIRQASPEPRVLCHASEVEKPKKMIDDDHCARGHKCGRCQGNQWPTGSEVLEVNHMAHDREKYEVQRERVVKVQQDVEGNDHLYGS